MEPPYIGEIRMFAGPWAPSGWAFCNGQEMRIHEHELLYALIGTTYGGNDQTFRLPDLRGRLPIHQGNLGGNEYQMGQKGGAEMVTLQPDHLPPHTHSPKAVSKPGGSADPENAIWATGTANRYNKSVTGIVSMHPHAISATGGSKPHENMAPSMAVHFIIALTGIWPDKD